MKKIRISEKLNIISLYMIAIGAIISFLGCKTLSYFIIGFGAFLGIIFAYNTYLKNN